MDNNKEWDELIKESFVYPYNLSGVEERFKIRIKKEQRKKKTILSSITALAASILFIVLINTNPAIANAVAEVPIIGKLVEYVRFDKSLSKAIANEYVQEVNLVAWDGDNRLFLPYVIADEKNLVLFFQMPEEFKQEENQWIQVLLMDMYNADTGEKVEGFGYSSSHLSLQGREDNFGFVMQDYYFSEGIVPKSIDIDIEIKTYNPLEKEEATISQNPYDFNSGPTYETIGTFNFHIELEDFVEPRIYEINEKHALYNQTIMVEYMKVYPTGTEVKFSFPNDNSALINGLELEVVQDDDKILKGNGNGISATTDIDNRCMSVFIESNYFDTPKTQELLIKGVRLLDKNEEFITIDIDNKTISPNIEGMELKEVIRESDNATLIFLTQIENDDNFGMFNHEYKDMVGNVYSFDSEGITSYNSQLETFITVKYPQSGKIVLQRTLTPKTLLEEPIRIKLPN